MMQEPDILRLKTNVSGAQAAPRSRPGLLGAGPAREEEPPHPSHAFQEPTLPLPGLPFLVGQEGQ